VLLGVVVIGAQLFVIKFQFYSGDREKVVGCYWVLRGQGAGRDEHAELVGRRPHAPQLLVAPAGLVLWWCGVGDG
jgi:hypothetical protein